MAVSADRVRTQMHERETTLRFETRRAESTAEGAAPHMARRREQELRGSAHFAARRFQRARRSYGDSTLLRLGLLFVALVGGEGICRAGGGGVREIGRELRRCDVGRSETEGVRAGDRSQWEHRGTRDAGEDPRRLSQAGV